MRRLFRIFLLLVLLVVVAVGGYGWIGYRDARGQADDLRARADALIEAGQGGANLGAERRAMLLTVEDPAFVSHYGFDLTTPGAGITTITQSLAKRVCFEQFQPGIAKIRQTGCAIGLETVLTKRQIMALFLDTVEMGAPSEDRGWVTGLFAASVAYYDAQLDQISDDEFIRLVALMIAPGELSRPGGADRLAEREARIARLIEGTCTPEGNRDVWLEGCAAPSQ